MIDVDWDIVADGTAIRLVTCEDAVYWAKDGYIWHNNGAYWVKADPDFIFQTIATRPKQTKTVADAVGWVRNGGIIDGEGIAEYTMLSFRKSNGSYSFVSEESSAGSFETKHWQPVCTRAEFEAYVKEQEGEKWTHTYSDYGVRKDCILIHDKPDIHGQVLALNRYDEYVLTGTVELKHIKPTISESELLHKIKDMAKGVASDGHFGDTVRGCFDDYDVVKD